MCKRIVCAFLLYLLVFVSSASAALFNVDFNDYNGPHWTGTINTTTDTLTISTWVENVVVGSYDPVFWKPTGLPLVWPAVSSTGSLFNIPDEWNGNFGTNWGFLSPVVLSGISFSEGTCTITTMKPGWNIYEIGGGITANTGVNRVDPWPRTAGATGTSIADQLEIKAVVPIPGAIWLLGSGLIGIAGIRWRLKK